MIICCEDQVWILTTLLRGSYRPDLTYGNKATSKEITIRTIAGIGDMPAYRDKITLEELNKMIAFLELVGPGIDEEAQPSQE
jgi:mono/diheme cytochrome c family protein